MHISKRLKCLASYVEQDSIIADIGCDHGLLPIYLREQGICQKAYACDLREGPLSRAKQAIDNAGYSGTISTILTNGLQDVPNDADAAIIAGMGFETIQTILEQNYNRVLALKYVILQANTNVMLLREWLMKHHFLIKVDTVIQDGHFYHILKCEPRGGRALTEDEVLFGVFQDSSDFYSYCQFELQKIDRILTTLSAQHENYRKSYNYKKKLIKKLERQ